MHSTSRYTRHEGVHFKMAKDADKVVPRNSRSNTKKRSRVFAFSGSDSLPPRLSGVDFAALYGKSYFTNEAFAYEYMHAAVVQQTLQLCDLLFELKRDSSPLALDAVRAHLTKEFESPFATKSRNEILTFLQTTIETAIQQSEAEAKVAITFADASITDLKKVLFTKLVDGPEQSNIKIKTDKTLITDRRVELGNGVEVHFSCSQLNAGCKFKDAADFEKQLRALATDEITDIKNLIYQIQARQKLIDQIDHPWISSDHSTPPPKYTPRLENLKRRVNKK
jgi:hypothetical protein